MHDLDLLVPAALVEPTLAVELLRAQALPQLTRLVAHASSLETSVSPADAALTTWQAWVLARRAGIAPERVNIAEVVAAARRGSPATRAGRYLAEPAHFVIARDHLVLDDPRSLHITPDEASALADAVEPVLAEAGWRLAPPDAVDAAHWLLTRDDGQALAAPVIERAIGGNVAAWQPRNVAQTTDGATTVAGADIALDWRRCVNEIQMLWFAHPVNAAREAAGRPTVNTLWLSGNGEPAHVAPRYAAIDSTLPLFAGVAVDPSATVTLETFDRFVAPTAGGDWGTWRDQLERLETRIAAVLRRQAAGELGTITLVLCGIDTLRAVALAAGDQRRFWRRWRSRPSLVALFSEAEPV